MIDILGAVFGTAVYSAQVGILAGLSPARGTTKLAAVAAAAAWGAIIVAVAALGGFAPAVTGPVPAPVLAFVLCLALLFGGWFYLPRFRNALLSVPLPALVALNVARLGGVFFLLLAARGRLSTSFASPAGLGDILVGALAIPLALAAARGVARPGWVRAWNTLGALDLIVAISAGLLSAPGTPFRVFTDGPGTLAMTELPWILVPAVIVPLYLLIHLAIAVKVRAPESARQAVAVAR